MAEKLGRSDVLGALTAAITAAEAHYPAGLRPPYSCHACGTRLVDIDAVCPNLARAAFAAAVATDTHAAHPAGDDVTLLTSGEWLVFDALSALHGVFVGLPEHHSSDVDEWRVHVHAMQNLLMARAAVRAYPGVFTPLRPTERTT